ncbi:cell wall hydrolase [Pseudogemmobacter faecipullorum]
MISPGNTLAAATFAVVSVLTQAAHADVTRSDKNIAGTVLADEMGSLLGSEKSRLNTFAGAELVSIAAGPEAVKAAAGETAAAPDAKPAAKPAAPVVMAAKAEEKTNGRVIGRSANNRDATAETAAAAAEAPAAEKKIRRVTFGRKTTDEKEATAKAGASAPAEGSLAMPQLRYDAGWLMAQPAPEGGKQWECLTEAIYFEARGESLKGQFAVAEVILNRVDSGLYPRTVCGVVNQRGGGACQFSYSCNGNSTKMRDRYAREIAGRIADVMLDGAERGLTNGATHFHTHAVNPSWSRRFARTTVIGAHNFYRQPGGRG